MNTLKFSLKRKMSGKAIKALKRQEKLKRYNIDLEREKFITWRKDRERKRKARRSSPTLYDLEFAREMGNSYSLYTINQVKEEIKRSGNKRKLRRLYKVVPGVDPKVIAKKKSEEKTRKYWEKQKELNEKINSKN